jgi:hypothetical protein
VEEEGHLKHLMEEVAGVLIFLLFSLLPKLDLEA